VLFVLLRYTDSDCLPLVYSNLSYVFCLWLCILCCAFVLFFLVLCCQFLRIVIFNRPFGVKSLYIVS
jgi:hypothetical protein